MTSRRLIKTAKIITLFSFFGGTIIFFWFYFTMNYNALFLGYMYIAFTVILNLGLLVVMLVRSLSDEESRSKLRSAGALMFVNIPVMFIYVGLTVMLLNRLRITLVNKTTHEIANIKLFGCEEHKIGNIPAGESKGVWVYIPTDCQVEMEYLLNGRKTNATVVEYASAGHGELITYEIRP
ncbi:MAG TPA: hypothetical protein VD905_20120 [Flavobacteriales bacterium]|nr:hypothetical protein [Flavobacteriales bacterium]